MKNTKLKINLIMLVMFGLTGLTSFAQFPTPTINCFNGGNVCSGSNSGVAGVTVAPVIHYTMTVGGSPFSTGAYDIGGAQFGPGYQNVSVTGNLVYMQDLAMSYDGCAGYAPMSMVGKVALIDRGTCYFEQKVYNAQLAGAVGVVIVDNVPEAPFDMGAVGLYPVTIPSVMIRQSDGANIKTAMTFGVNVYVHTPTYNYFWSDGESTPTIFNLFSGFYYVYVNTDDNMAFSVCSTYIGEFPNSNPTITTNSGYSEMCAPYSLILDAGPGFTSYKWNTGPTTQTIAVNYASTFSVITTDVNGCTGYGSITTSVANGVPAQPGAINGPANGLCNQSFVFYYINPVATAVNYQWTVPAGATIINGQGTTGIIVSFGTFANGTISVKAFNPCGWSSARNLNVSGGPGATGPISGPISGVCKQNNVPYSVAAGFGTGYTWTVPSGVGIAAGQGTSTVWLNFLPSFSSGNICAKAINGCGNSANTCIAVVAKPSAPVIINGPAGICHFQQNVGYNVASVYGAATYTWTVPDQAFIVSGQGTPSIVVNFGGKVGNVSVKASNACGNSATISLALHFICRDDLATSIESDDILLYPNPAHGELHLQFNSPKDTKGDYRLIDLAGRILLEKTADILVGDNTAEFNLQGIASGIYFLEIAPAGLERKTLRVVVE